MQTVHLSSGYPLSLMDPPKYQSCLPRDRIIQRLTGQKSELPSQHMYQQSVSSQPVISQQVSVKINVYFSHNSFVTFQNGHSLTMD